MTTSDEKLAIDLPDNAGPDMGVYSVFGDLPDGTIITEQGLANLFEKHPVSIKRAVERGELPPPTRLMGKPIWTVGAIRKYINQRLAEASEEQQRLEERLRRYQP